MENKEFPDLTASELRRYARGRAAALGLHVPEAYLAGVLENLAALQAHAAILRASLEGGRPRMLRSSAP
jgi:hypothetical protein